MVGVRKGGFRNDVYSWVCNQNSCGKKFPTASSSAYSAPMSRSNSSCSYPAQAVVGISQFVFAASLAALLSVEVEKSQKLVMLYCVH